MSRFLPPFCLLMALLSLICGFALMAKGAPDVSIELHQARLLDDEPRKEALEKQLKIDRWRHYGLSGGLFVFSAIFTGTAFLSMTPSKRRD